MSDNTYNSMIIDETKLSYPLLGYLRDTSAAYRMGKDTSAQVRAFIQREHGDTMAREFDSLLPKMIIALGKGR